ncbi:MAG: Ig-like domain-containing protein [Bacteroidota bacterium]|nr:Ig-like domain-containing protein [Bacteroidota bacterium]
MKIKKLLSIFGIVSFVLITACKKDDFVEIAGLCPVVISTNPTNGATNVPLDQIITVTFNEEMNASTITASSFTIQGLTPITGTISFSGVTATFVPSVPLTTNTTYTGKVTTSVKNLMGSALQTDYIWTFSTGSTLTPNVISTDPANNEINVVLNKIITATFSTPMDPTSLNTSTFTLKSGTTAITGVVTYLGTTASFTPNSPLTANTTYTGTITTGAKNAAGTSFLANDYVWTFQTGSGMTPFVISTDPANNETGVVLTKIITATFSVPMNPSTINATSFTIRQGTVLVTGTVSYNGVTASFDPTTNLLPNTTYTGMITTAVKDLLGNSMQANYIWTFSTGLTLAPMVIATDPTNNATGVALNKIVSATFSMPMNPSTLNVNTFTIREGNTPVAGTVTYSGVTSYFTPSTALKANTVYTATITTGAKNPAGISIPNDYVWTFTTANSLAPLVISTDPANNETGVPLNKTVTATFNMFMDPTTINSTTFTLRQGNNSIAGTVTYVGTTASFRPNSSLQPNTIYTGTITTGAKNLAGVPLANDYVWTFTTANSLAPTVISTDPTNNETGVALNKVVTATFSMFMDPLTINTSTFTLKQGNTQIAGTVTYVGTTASFTPSSALLPNMIYTGTITTGAKNLAGVPLANNYVWTFTTALAPIVISTDPANNATGVPVSKIITATFNMAMDPLTINTTTFTLKQGNVVIVGTVSYSGTTATFRPTSALSLNTIYTATITTGAKNLAGVPLATNYVWSFTTATSISAPFVDLRSVERFGIIAGVGVSNNAGFSEIRNLDVGISPGVRSSVTGFPPAIVVNGAIFASDDVSPPGVAEMLIQAKADLMEAYLFAQGASDPPPITVSGDLGGRTLAPGIYKTNSTLLVASGNLTLDAQGDGDAVWIFQIASGFTTVGGAGGDIILTGGARASNVFWQTGSSATIGDGTLFKGNILALTSITMNSGAVAVGRMLASNGAVVMTNTNIINRP